MTISTKERLAIVLMSEGLDALAERARAGEFDDFESEHPVPKMLLIGILTEMGRFDLASRVMHGEWDNTIEEAEQWSASIEGQRCLHQLILRSVPRRRADDH